ncbi:arginine--tRNA ligase [Longirhabdus pacifica]|uniref:arginine--tRNA ligase n=1 Tax=Longirhabdus pacifica TaxID=2305227 RepID=UPI0010086C6C|nr:arginine--tRNA ligase [Longirhabdus pacifica]
MMVSILKQIEQTLLAELQQAVVKAEICSTEQLPSIHLEKPKDETHGDYATNVAMQLTKIARKNPREIAQSIQQHIDMEKAHIKKMEIAGPGFLNFYMNKAYLHQVIHEVVEQAEHYGRSTIGSGKKVQVEFVSANPTGSLHLGHARGAAIGDALCNIFDFAGFDVTREYYVNDGGNQMNNLAISLEARYMQALGMEKEMPEDGYYAKDIIQYAEALKKEKGDSLLSYSSEDRLNWFKTFGLEKQLNKIKADLHDFQVDFDVWFSESSLYESDAIDEVLQLLKQKGKVYEEEGALWLETMPYGDDKNRVLIKKDGSYTYLTPDIAYHKNKYDRGFDVVMNIWGADHHGYINRVKAAMSALDYDANKLEIIISQMVSLFENGEKVKMSKRTGKAVTMQELIEQVGVDAVRYFFIMRSTDSHLDFDLDLAVSKSNENPVFYVQYAHARICSILTQAEEQGVTLASIDEVDFSLLDSKAELAILNKIAQLQHEITLAAEQRAPHRIVRYIYELAGAFHSYYKGHRVIQEEEQALTQARLYLITALRTVLQNVLKLIGVSAPEKM